MSGGIPGVLFADFNSQEACQAPQRITQSLAEALPPHHSWAACLSRKAAVTGVCPTMENASSLITKLSHQITGLYLQGKLFYFYFFNFFSTMIEYSFILHFIYLLAYFFGLSAWPVGS